ncbi:MAG: non-hydrolyzing UDP-N-acetylglucosamine 2-epimerase [Anaerolineales bacterium]
MKILSIVGARPEFVQAMPISQALRSGHQEVLVHTGQHYDYQMSEAFFDELDIPVPDYNLGVGSATQAQQTAEIMVGLEKVLLEEKPDFIVMRGDTNSSLAAALTASKLNIPFAHVEAGERSFNRTMPEEINRLVADRLANLHFCVSQAAERNLSAEGLTGSVYWVGDVMLDALLYVRPFAREKSKILEKLQTEPRNYSLVTIHRAANTDDPKRLEQIVAALNQVSEIVILPMHPRTQKALSGLHLHFEDNVRIIDPVGYFDMLVLEENARLIATDSGGVQREAYYLKIPCLTLRDETEWMGTVEAGWNKLTGADQNLILENWFGFIPPNDHPSIYGVGNAAQRIVDVLDNSVVSKLDHKLPGRHLHSLEEVNSK